MYAEDYLYSLHITSNTIKQTFLNINLFFKKNIEFLQISFTLF